MRLYTFSHFMLSPMAKGIQTLHSTVELFNKYSDQDKLGVTLYEWSTEHKTCISLNGGLSPGLKELEQFLVDPNNPYPWATFNEDESLGKLMTAISIVIPEKIYEASSFMTNKNFGFRSDGFIGVNSIDLLTFEDIDILKKLNSSYSTFEQELISRLGKYRLAS